MAYQQIVDQGIIASGFIMHGAVFTKQGFLAASSQGFSVQKQDFDGIMKCFKDPAELYKKGVTINKVKFIAISGNPRTIHCKIGPDGMICIRAKNCVILGIYRPPVMAPQALNAMELVADAINNGKFQTTDGAKAN